MAEPREMGIEELNRIAEVLLGAAYADGEHVLEEAQTIREILVELQGGRELPEPVHRRLQEFDPGRFDLKGTCAALEMTTPERRRWLLRLVARVTECDDLHDLEESDYIVRLAKQIGASPEEYEGLTVEAIYEEPVQPPPVPQDD